MLHVEPQMLPRLDEIEADLKARQDRAESEGWRGEIEGIEVTLDHLRSKRDRVQRIGPTRAVTLPMPVVRDQSRG
jgi:molecular chaperone GrpE (heat shock protein)